MRRPLGVQSKNQIGDYLGCPMEVDGRSFSSLNPIMRKSLDRILSWKFVNISQMGKLLLINSILTCLASHIISIYLLPKRISNKLSSLFLKYWWSSSISKTPIYWRKKEVLSARKLSGVRNQEYPKY